MTSRVLFSIDDDVLERFRAAIPSHERSKVIEDLMRREIEYREEQRESHIEQLALQVETDPRFTAVRSVTGDIDNVAGEAID